jgi:cell division transport system permease protein
MLKSLNFYNKSLLTGTKKLIKQPMLTIFNIVIFTLLISFLIVILSFIKSNNEWKSSIMSYPKMVIYLKNDNNHTQLKQIFSYLQNSKSSISNFRYLSSNDAMKEFITESNINNNIDNETLNQLPNIIIVNLNNANISDINTIITKLQQFNIVQTVDIDKTYINKVSYVASILNNILSGLIIFIITLLSLIIYHHIKIRILHSKEEIKIQKLIGATNYFILLPILFIELIQITISLFISYLIYSLIFKNLNMLLANLSLVLERKIMLINLSTIDMFSISLLVICLTIITTYTAVQSILTKTTN